MYKNMSKINMYHGKIKFIPKYCIIYIISIIYLNLLVFAFDYLFFFYKKGIMNDLLNINFGVLVVLFMVLFTLYVLYLAIDLIHSIISNGQYVEINFEGIIIKKLFKEIALSWDEIHTVEIHYFRLAKTIRISLKKDLRINRFVRIFGTWFGLFYIDINTFKYNNINIQKFINTATVCIK